MRQRLFLVAGWIGAAIGAGLIATAAVAVAGGQVLDQPLRPLTAAEVAALPVASAEPAVAAEPERNGSAPVEPGKTFDRSNTAPAGPPAIGGTVAINPETSGPEVFGPTRPSIVRTGSVEGGHASFLVTDEGLALLWATPSPGYIAQTRSVQDETITVLFSSSLHAWLIEATIDGTDITIVTRPQPLT